MSEVVGAAPPSIGEGPFSDELTCGILKGGVGLRPLCFGWRIKGCPGSFSSSTVAVHGQRDVSAVSGPAGQS